MPTAAAAACPFNTRARVVLSPASLVSHTLSPSLSLLLSPSLSLYLSATPLPIFRIVTPPLMYSKLTIVYLRIDCDDME